MNNVICELKEMNNNDNNIVSCVKCGSKFPHTEEYFYRNKTSRNGIMKTCKTCFKAMRIKRPCKYCNDQKGNESPIKPDDETLKACITILDRWDEQDDNIKLVVSKMITLLSQQNVM